MSVPLFERIEELQPSSVCVFYGRLSYMRREYDRNCIFLHQRSVSANERKTNFGLHRNYAKYYLHVAARVAIFTFQPEAPSTANQKMTAAPRFPQQVQVHLIINTFTLDRVNISKAATASI